MGNRHGGRQPVSDQRLQALPHHPAQSSGRHEIVGPDSGSEALCTLLYNVTII